MGYADHEVSASGPDSRPEPRPAPPRPPHPCPPGSGRVRSVGGHTAGLCPSWCRRELHSRLPPLTPPSGHQGLWVQAPHWWSGSSGCPSAAMVALGDPGQAFAAAQAPDGGRRLPGPVMGNSKVRAAVSPGRMPEGDHTLSPKSLHRQPALLTEQREQLLCSRCGVDGQRSDGVRSVVMATGARQSFLRYSLSPQHTVIYH